MNGPFETERQARETPAVRAVYAAFDLDPGVGKMAPHNLAMLLDACADAGVAVGAYDSRILRWLAQWEPQTCAVVAGLITRAHAAGTAGPQAEHDDPEPEGSRLAERNAYIGTWSGQDVTRREEL